MRLPAEHLDPDAYGDRLDALMEGLLALETANPEHLADPSVAGRCGPVPSRRLVDVDVWVRADPRHQWAAVPSMPDCFPTGATIDQIRDALRTAIERHWARPER